jgi:hypothetical protein
LRSNVSAPAATRRWSRSTTIISRISTPLLDDLAAGRPVHIGPQNGRLRSEPLGGLTALTEFYGADGKSGPLSDMQAALQPANPAK